MRFPTKITLLTVGILVALVPTVCHALGSLKAKAKAKESITGYKKIESKPEIGIFKSAFFGKIPTCIDYEPRTEEERNAMRSIGCPIVYYTEKDNVCYLVEYINYQKDYSIFSRSIKHETPGLRESYLKQLIEAHKMAHKLGWYPDWVSGYVRVLSGTILHIEPAEYIMDMRFKLITDHRKYSSLRIHELLERRRLFLKSFIEIYYPEVTDTFAGVRSIIAKLPSLPRTNPLENTQPLPGQLPTTN
ncbi:hypothetical protein BDF22DRAFT_703553 [Syncephalis plumigaleata]|nr:hypothetical protein BDF22DRAFT_703553 [Syncephalis plumigaleata]